MINIALEEKLSKEKNAELVSEIEYKNKLYIKAVKDENKKPKFVYYEIKNNEFKEVEDENILLYFKEKFELKPDDRIY